MNSKQSYTPGPWTTHIGIQNGKPFGDIYGYEADGTNVIVARSSSEPIDVAANARLIAAAPELLDLAKRARFYFAPDQDGHQDMREIIDALIARIESSDQ